MWECSRLRTKPVKLKSQRSLLVLISWRYSQIPEHSWETSNADPTPSCLCEHKRQGRGLPPLRKNGFPKLISGVQRCTFTEEAGRVEVSMNRIGPFSKNTNALKKKSLLPPLHHRLLTSFFLWLHQKQICWKQCLNSVLVDCHISLPGHRHVKLI